MGQTLRLARHNVEQASVIVVHLRKTGQHADRACDRGQRITNLVSDRGSEPSHSSQPVLHADFALQPADLGQIIEGIYVAEITFLRNG